MAQHDYIIANQTFPNTRTDINNVLAAIVSANSGASAPSTTYAYQLWYDTTTNKLKLRNAADDAWIDLFDVDQVADTATPTTGGGGGGGGGATGGGTDEIFYENDQNVTTDYTITDGKNAMSAGPITINSGVTVTIGAGETWTVV